MGKMEVTVQWLVNDRGEFQRWKPSIQKKVIEMTEALSDICSQVDKAGQKTIRFPPPLPTSEDIDDDLVDPCIWWYADGLPSSSDARSVSATPTRHGGCPDSCFIGRYDHTSTSCLVVVRSKSHKPICFHELVPRFRSKSALFELTCF
jgi:hypothetical protein